MTTYLRSWTTLVRINTGPPTWWKPNASVRRHGRIVEIRFGWLRMCVQIGISTRREVDKERGASAVEYTLMVAGVAVAVLLVLPAFNALVSQMYVQTSCSMDAGAVSTPAMSPPPDC